MDIVIRRAEPGEYEILGEITAQAYLRDGLLDFGEDDAYLGVLRDVAGRAAHADVLVAAADSAVRGRPARDGAAPGRGERDGAVPEGAAGAAAVLGGVTFVPAGGPMADIASPGEAEIRMLAVSRAARGRGVGEALVRACVHRARAVPGCVRVVLSTQPTMRTAHRLYERLGFTRTPGRDWNPLPQQLPDMVLLTYELPL
ncbi:GNAT family N-acetyltransferase [Streptomyces sp. NPDC005925]|uniref:GNAT family N-acetyltransferase n=1 Tax=Streptomyces sp. NPDC005925 TaxID=3157172 RepID=UPI0033D03E3A